MSDVSCSKHGNLEKMEEDEDVIFENSPLQKYLKEVGFSENEGTKRHQVREEYSSSIADFLLTWVKSSCYEKKDFVCGLFRSLFGTTPSWEDLKANRKDYILVVTNSNILNEDDLGFLSNFDPELFCPREQKGDKSSDETSGYIQTLKSHAFEYRSAFVVLVAASLATVSEFFYASMLLVTVVFLVEGRKFLIQLYCIKQHRKYLEDFKSYIKQVKDLALLLRKSIMYIQEMELVSRGHTFVGIDIPSLFLEKDEEKILHRTLRQTILKSTKEMISCSQKAAKQLLECYPLVPELDRMFITYLSRMSVDLFIGEKEAGPSNYENLSLQSLKTLASTLVNLQSGFLSRFLLCLSVEANKGDLFELHNKLLRRIDKIFGTPLAVLKASLTAVETSFHIHKSACFVTKKKRQPYSKTHSKCTGFETALHSLEVHLQVGLLRIQSLQSIYSKLAKKEIESGMNVMEVSHTTSNLETGFKCLKIDLDAMIPCWEEAESRLNIVLNRKSVKQVDDKPLHKEGDFSLMESQVASTVEFDKDVVESDRVFEAFADSYNETCFDQSILTAEDLAEEKKKSQESQHLLHELKMVLSCKAKDPLISSAGFVQPVRPPSQNQDSTKSLPDAKLEKEIPTWDAKEIQTETLHSGTLKNKIAVDEIQFGERNIIQQRLLLADMEYSRENEMHQSAVFSNLCSTIAVSTAMAAAMRTKTMGLSEEDFTCDDSG